MNESTINEWDFSGSPVLETLHSNAGCVGAILGWEAKIPHASWPIKQHRKQKQTVTNSIKALKVIHIKIIFKNNESIQGNISVTFISIKIKQTLISKIA